MHQQRTILLAEPDATLRAYLVNPVRLGRLQQVSARLAASRQQSRAEVRAAGATHAN